MSSDTDPAAGVERSFWESRRPLALIVAIGALVAHGVWFPVLHHGHSAHIDLIRQTMVDQSYHEGYVYPRWIADFYFGRGSPIFNFYAPLVYLIGQVFCLAGFSPLAGVKGVYILFTILAGTSMYLLAREVFGARIGFASAVLYLLSPYLLVDLYVRGALAEFSGFAWLALAMYFFLRSARTLHPQDAVSGGGATALLCLSHNITAMVGVPMLVAWILVVKDRAPLRRQYLSLAAGLAASSFFWLPALWEKSYLNAEANLTEGAYHYSRHFLSLVDLVSPSWGFGSAIGAGGGTMSRQIGLVHLLLAIPALVWLARARGWDLRRRATAGFALMAAVSVYFTTSWSRPFWDHLPLLRFTQFPWRFLLPATLAFTGLAGAAMFAATHRLSDRAADLAVLAMLATTLAAYGGYAEARYLLHDRNDPNRMVMVTRAEAAELRRRPEYVEAQELLEPWVLREVRETKSSAKDDYLPKWVRTKPSAFFKDRAQVVSGDAEIEPLALQPAGYRFRVRAKTPTRILVHTFYFPGWRARVGSRLLPLSVDADTGEMTVDVDPGVQDLRIEFEDTRVRLFSKLASLTAVAAILGWLGVSQYLRVTGAPAGVIRAHLRERVSNRIRRRRLHRRHPPHRPPHHPPYHRP